MKRPFVFLLSLALIVSLGFNVYMMNLIRQKQVESLYRATLVFGDANSRETYFTVHNVRQAHTLSKGAGVKVGILDMYFGYQSHPDLYSGGKDFARQNNDFNNVSEHGFWMAMTLKEIAPEAEIYALGIDAWDEGKRVAQIYEAVDWAIENGLDILTYSNQSFSPQHKEQLDTAVRKAVEHNIVTTFIWYPHPDNLLPGGLSSKLIEGVEADIHILHYDYNSVRVGGYLRFASASEAEQLSMMHPFMSYSSTSPVAAGFVALLKSLNNTLPPALYKTILMETGREMEFGGEVCHRVVDIDQAVQKIAGLQ